MGVVFFKELRFIIASPFSSVVVALYTFFFSLVLYVASYGSGVNDLSVFATAFTWFVLFFNPLLAARMFAEEFSQKSYELLFTSAIGSLSIVLAKFFAVCVFFAITLALTLPAMATLVYFSSAKLSLLWIAFYYLQFLLVGFFALAVGLFCSAISSTVFIACLLAFFVIVFLLLFDFFSLSLPKILQEIWQALALQPHLEQFKIGLFALHHALYFLLTIVFLLAATLFLFERRRWKNA